MGDTKLTVQEELKLAQRELAIFLHALGPKKMTRVIESMTLGERYATLCALNTMGAMDPVLFASWLLYPELLVEIAEKKEGREMDHSAEESRKHE